uniref:ZP domain-containing protein n=1 Tax=Meloidogyne incognita TaxID=6306 RepID=A0A914LM90_MELIC
MNEALFGLIEYKTDLEAIQRGNAFKFADRNTIYFNCQLRLELKNGWKECQVCVGVKSFLRGLLLRNCVRLLAYRPYLNCLNCYPASRFTFPTLFYF